MITKDNILKEEKYRKMPIEQLAEIILYKISPEDYDAIEGITSVGKAKNLHQFWNTQQDINN